MAEEVNKEEIVTENATEAPASDATVESQSKRKRSA